MHMGVDSKRTTDVKEMDSAAYIYIIEVYCRPHGLRTVSYRTYLSAM